MISETIKNPSVRNKKKAFTLVEVLIAASIFTIGQPYWRYGFRERNADPKAGFTGKRDLRGRAFYDGAHSARSQTEYD